MPASPHDALFKSTFEQPDIARSQLELVLPAAVRAHLDLATLEVHPGSFLDRELQQTPSWPRFPSTAPGGKTTSMLPAACAHGARPGASPMVA
jgi:hypothetical protein